MFNIVKNVLRNVRKRLFQYIGIVVLLVVVVAAMTGLYGTSERVSASFYNVGNHSGTYDYRIKIERLSDFTDIDDSLIRIKDILKEQFPETLPNYDTIVDQIDQIKNNDIQNGLLPTINNGTIDDDLKLLLLNWGISYKAILVNDILNNEFMESKITSYYQIKKSFLKSFDTNQTKRLFFSFEDAFYLEELPPWITDQNKRFDFSPFRNGFDKVYITGGKEPEALNEVIINPTFAKTNNIALDDEFEFIDGEILKVVGFGYAYWGIIAEISSDNISPSPENTTQVFTTREWSNRYLGSTSAGTKIEVPFLLKVPNKDSFFENKTESIFSEFFNFNYGNLITRDTDDYRSGFLKPSFDMANIIYSSISFFVMLAAVFIVLSYVRKEIDLQKKQIGLIKALGYTNNEVSFGFTMLIFLISIFSTAIGFALGLPLQIYFNGLNNFGYVLPLPVVHFSWIALLIGVVFSTIIFTLASYLQSYSVLTKNPLALIHDQTTDTSTKWLAFFKKPFSYWSFKPRLAVSFALKSIGKLTLIFFTFVFVSFLLLFQTIVSDVFDSKIDNLQNYVNSDVYLTSRTFNMYKFDDQGNIDFNSKVYDWVIEKNLDPDKAIKSDDIHIDNSEKYARLKAIYEADDFRSYYIKSEEMTLLYNNITNDGINYIKPPGTDFISAAEAFVALTVLNQFFDIIINYTGMDPSVEPLPSISVGQMILNNDYYPNLDFVLNTPARWFDHNQGPLASKLNRVITLYNNSDPDNPLAWKNWFNMKEERGLDIDPIFNSSHSLTQESVTYIDSFGQTKTQNAYIIPSVISKSLAVLNKYKIGDQVLMILNTSAEFVPIIFDIKGVTVTNLDMSHFYVQIDDLRKIIGYVDTVSGQPIPDSFNNYYSKEKTFLPLNSINILQSNADYSRAGLLNSWSLINRDPVIFSLLKGRLIEMFKSVQDIIDITKWLTIIALAFVLVIIINMILDNNILIIAMMRAIGYRINEINGLIIGSYIFALILAFIVGAVLGYVAWWLILILVAKFASTIFLLPISAVTILVSFALVFLVIIIGYAIGLYFIKFKPVTSLLQSE